MDYYEEPRQYDALNQSYIKFPTRTNLVGANKKEGILKFASRRERADIDVSVMTYQD